MAEVYVKGQQNALTDLIDFDKISEQDLKDIINSKRNALRHSKSSDDARRQIIRAFTFETPLYSAVNRVCQWCDESAVPTLGPYGALLYSSIACPPLDNQQL